jgi:acyl carrier protein
MNHPTLCDLTDIVGAYVDLSSVAVTEASVLGDDIPIDSQEMLRVVSRIKALYRVTLTGRDLFAVVTMGDLLAAVRRGMNP